MAAASKPQAIDCRGSTRTWPARRGLVGQVQSAKLAKGLKDVNRGPDLRNEVRLLSRNTYEPDKNVAQAIKDAESKLAPDQGHGSAI
jgi:hypothetical protein